MTLTQPRPIKDYCLGIYDGPHATPQESSDGPIFLGIRNITNDGRLDLSDIRHVSEEEFPRWTRRVTPQANDVVFTYEATLHRYALIPEGFRGCLGRRIALVRPDPSQVDSRYLLYFFLSDGWRMVIEGNVISGATVDRIPLEKFPSFPAALPILTVQRKVADILSAYDDLIENNRRRMVLLEEAARQLYREWFVRLRFPGHEHTRITYGVPVGWERVYLGDVVDTQYGYTETATEEMVGPKFLRGTDINKTQFIDWSTVPYCPIEDNLKRKYQLQVNDIVIIRMADPGKVAIVERDIEAVFASYLIRLLRNDPRLTPYYLFYVLSGDEYQGFVSGVSTGSTRKTANARLLVDFHLVLPSAALLNSFEDAVRPLRQQITTLLVQNEKLRAARDLLLPRLMSGKIAV
jgi:type I restriction enzyme, S subunit